MGKRQRSYRGLVRRELSCVLNIDSESVGDAAWNSSCSLNRVLDLRFEERLSVGDGNREIRSAEVAHHGKVNSNNLALAVEKGTTGAS